jgi:hypothetical protein
MKKNASFSNKGYYNKIKKFVGKKPNPTLLYHRKL